MTTASQDAAAIHNVNNNAASKKVHATTNVGWDHVRRRGAGPTVIFAEAASPLSREVNAVCGRLPRG